MACVWNSFGRISAFGLRPVAVVFQTVKVNRHIGRDARRWRAVLKYSKEQWDARVAEVGTKGLIFFGHHEGSTPEVSL